MACRVAEVAVFVAIDRRQCWSSDGGGDLPEVVTDGRLSTAAAGGGGGGGGRPGGSSGFFIIVNFRNSGFHNIINIHNNVFS